MTIKIIMPAGTIPPLSDQINPSLITLRYSDKEPWTIKPGETATFKTRIQLELPYDVQAQFTPFAPLIRDGIILLSSGEIINNTLPITLTLWNAKPKPHTFNYNNPVAIISFTKRAFETIRYCEVMDNATIAIITKHFKPSIYTEEFEDSYPPLTKENLYIVGPGPRGSTMEQMEISYDDGSDDDGSDDEGQNEGVKV